MRLGSPKISPDPESGTTPLSRPLNRSEMALDFPFFAITSKPGSCPESRDSPIIYARQEIFSRK